MFTPSNTARLHGLLGMLRTSLTTAGHWLAESRGRRVLCLVVGLWVLNMFDLAFTILAHEQGMLDEANPLAQHVVLQGPLSIALYKIGLLFIGSYPLLRFRSARVTELAALTAMGVYVLLAFRWSVCYEFYTLSASNTVHVAEIEAILGG